ncbi:hypothetical protein LINGRAHAP2_LOCUS18604 [Linum grandiflorum]
MPAGDNLGVKADGRMLREAQGSRDLPVWVREESGLREVCQFS